MNLGRIEVFPIKSLDGLSVEQARITPGGILEHDRVFAIVNGEGKAVNGKRTARIHQLRCRFDEDVREVQLWENGGSPVGFHLCESQPVSDWLSSFFGYPVTLQHNAAAGFPDDTVASGPTITSEASLRAVLRWFPDLTLTSARRRFRTNLELTGDEEFCEDRLYGEPKEVRPFQIGDVQFAGHNPCQRCVVPTREAESGEPIPGFQKLFMRYRQESLPPWAARAQFNHFYRIAVNTSIPTSEAGKILRVGDPIFA